MKLRVPEHFALQIVQGLALPEQLVVLWALKLDAHFANNDTIRSVTWSRLFAMNAGNYESDHRLENSVTNPAS